MRPHIPLFLAGALIVGPLPALEIAGNTITLSADEVAACATEGGCVVATRKAIGAAIEQAAERAVAQAKERGTMNCGNRA